jgi:membrane-associated protease RseP (regulator of RpoE activity)
MIFRTNKPKQMTMKNMFQFKAGILAGVLIGSLSVATALAGDDEPKVVVTADADTEDLPAPPTPATPPTPPVPGHPHTIVRSVGSGSSYGSGGSHSGTMEATWLGVGVEESPDVLTAQLGLKPGQGLVVNFVATNSPAASAGLQKNDVLAEFEGQMLVDASQLRKLVRMHAEGDGVKITFYRAGKKDSVSAKLVKKTFDEMSFGDETNPGNWGDLHMQMQDMHNSLGADQGAMKAQQGMMKIEIQQAMEQAQKAIQDAMRQMPQAQGPDGQRKLEVIRKQLGGLADGGVNVGKDATVVVKNEGGSVRTVVKSDDTGSYVIVADPHKRLTVHDPDGKLIFDGSIETKEEQQKVPRKVWHKVEPMLNDLARQSAPAAAPEARSDSSDD